MAQYKITDKAAFLEVNGRRLPAGTVLDESEFRPASGNTFTYIDPETKTESEKPEPGELESLLATGLVEANA